MNLRVDGDLIVDLVPQSHAQASVPSSLGTHSTEHRPHTARSQKASRLDEVEKLSSPYLMLADVLEALRALFHLGEICFVLRMEKNHFRVSTLSFQRQ